MAGVVTNARPAVQEGVEAGLREGLPHSALRCPEQNVKYVLSIRPLRVVGIETAKGFSLVPFHIGHLVRSSHNGVTGCFPPRAPGLAHHILHTRRTPWL